MELNREQIIKALECCHSSELSCIDCPYQDTDKYLDCANLSKNALVLIKELTEQVEKDNKTIIDLYHECETYLAQRDCFRNQVKNLTEENERLRADVAKEFTCVFGQPHRVGDCPIDDEIAKAKANNVSEIKTQFAVHFGTYCEKDQVKIADVFWLLDKIAKEMV